MRNLRVVSVVLLVAGAALVAASAVRIAVYWVIDPFNGLLIPAGAAVLAAGLVAGAASLPALRGRPFRAAAVLAAAGLLLIGVVRLVVELPLGPAVRGDFVAYGPGTPPSLSWTLLQGQVAGPTLALVAVLLLGAALLAAIAGTARTVSSRIRLA